MPHTHRKFSLAPVALAASAALAALPAHADVRYTSQMTFGAPSDTPGGATPAGMTMPGLRTTTYVKDNRERVETVMDMGPIHQNTVALTLCDKHQTVKMDPALKIYTIAPISAPVFSPPPRMHGKDSMPEGKPGVGHVTMTFGLQDMGTEKVAELDAHHFKMTIRTQTTGCLGDNDNTMQMEEWVAPVKAGLNCPERFSPTRTFTNERGCLLTYDMKGDWTKMRDAYGGMVVRMKMYSGDKVVATQDLRDYSLAALDDSLFAVPDDYKQLSATDYEKAESDAMRKGMMGHLGDLLSGAAHDTGQAAGDAATGAASDAANGAASSASDTANGAASSASDAANGTVNSAGDAASGAVDAARAGRQRRHQKETPSPAVLTTGWGSRKPGETREPLASPVRTQAGGPSPRGVRPLGRAAPRGPARRPRPAPPAPLGQRRPHPGSDRPGPGGRPLPLPHHPHRG